MRKLLREIQAIKRFIDIFGVVTKDQMKVFLADTAISYKQTIDLLVKMGGYVVMDGQCIVNKRKQVYDLDMINSIWIVLDYYKKQYPEIPVAKNYMLTQVIPNDTVASLVYIDADMTANYVVPVNKITTINITLIQDAMYSTGRVKRGQEDKSKKKIMFVVDDESLLDVFENTPCAFPYTVAVIDVETMQENGLPQIEYYTVE